MAAASLKQVLPALFCCFLGVQPSFLPSLAAQSPAKEKANVDSKEANDPVGRDASHLRFALVLSRHGVRSPTWTNARLDEYAAQPWPQWPVGPGLLTPHGKRLMTLFGAYYRSYFAERGLISKSGCADSSRIFIDADSDERTIETGKGLADGLAPGCGIPVNALGDGARDPIFHPFNGAAAFSSELATGALSGRIGNDPGALLYAYLAPLKRMQEMLIPCGQQPCAAMQGKKILLAAKPSLIPGSGDHLAELKGPLPTAATLAENLQLEYLEGMPTAQVGWGRVDEDAVRDLMTLHAASSDLVQRTPYIAHAQAANLLGRIELTLEQAERKKQLDGAVGTTSNQLVYLVGHDTNIANIAALLDAHWLVNGYPRDDVPPGAALVFELWENEGSSDTVRVYYTVQTPAEMRLELPLSAGMPPARAIVFLPGCSRGDQNASCEWKGFEQLLRSKL